jgi:hypothetical protein
MVMTLLIRHHTFSTGYDIVTGTASRKTIIIARDVVEQVSAYKLARH